MTVKKPTQKQIASLVGGKPLAQSFDPETGSLFVIAPTGQKFHFTPKDWTKSMNLETEVSEEHASSAKKIQKR